ncbi:MAG: hypothetical protein ABI613_10885, partial [Gemmatimonadota bacterium]
MKKLLLSLAAIGALFLLLCIPERDAALPVPSGSHKAFAWNRDAFWSSLESEFQTLRARGCGGRDTLVPGELAALRGAISRGSGGQIAADSPLLDTLETRYLSLAPAVAACPAYAGDYFQLSGQIREVIKWQSRGWDVNSDVVRGRLYRALYGTRAAVEEVMLHHPDGLPSLLAGRDEPSATPLATVHGIRIHSGDILVSRGGYPTSALIARGNDYPGNFSHIALIHVDSGTHAASAIEAHIERGVAISTADEYLADKKLRILVLRPRADLPRLLADPMLPHKAATFALERARTEVIPYDFAMDYQDSGKLFCS